MIVPSPLSDFVRTSTVIQDLWSAPHERLSETLDDEMADSGSIR
jgi:hypothetical protein